jgi:hypothetical protein
MVQSFNAISYTNIDPSEVKKSGIELYEKESQAKEFVEQGINDKGGLNFDRAAFEGSTVEVTFVIITKDGKEYRSKTYYINL